MADIAFWVIVGITIGSAFMVVQSKSLLYSAYAYCLLLLESLVFIFFFGQIF